MSNWKLVRAADFIDFNPYEHIEKGAMTKKVGMEQLQPFARDILSYEIVPFTGGSKFRNGDTLMARITPCLENGKTAQVNILNDGEVGFGSTEFIVLRAIPDVSDKNFIYYLTISSILREKAIKSMVGSSGRQRVQQGVINDMEFFAPPLAEQIKIGRILQTLDNKIAINTKINNHLEQIAQAIFKSWFVDFEPFGGKMPKDWKKGLLGQFVDVRRGCSPRPIQNFLSDKGLPWLKISDITTLQTPFVLEIKEHIKESGLKKTIFLKSGTLVLSNSATPGIPKILGIDTCIHDGWLYFPFSLFSNEYLYLLFKHIQKDLIALGNGSIFTNLKIDILKNYVVNDPDKQTRCRFDKLVRPIFREIEYRTQESLSLSKLRNDLLPKLMSGEIDVSQFKTD
jgi:hypothetical protein